MACNLFAWNGQMYSAENLREALTNPGAHESVFWQYHADELEKIKGAKDDVKGLYAPLFEGNEKEVAFEAAVQANSSPSEKKGAIRTFGEKIVDIAQKIFPSAKVGSSYQQELAREVNKLFPTQSFAEQSFEDRMTSILQNRDIIGKKRYNNEYWVMKTAPYLARNQYQPEETLRRNLEKIRQINEKMGYDAIHVIQRGDGYIVRINPQLRAFNEMEEGFEEWIPNDEVEQVMYSQIFNDSEEPITTDVLNNVATMAHDLNRPDLVEIARYIYQYLNKNPGLKIRVAAELADDQKAAIRNADKTLAVYNAATNIATFSLSKMSMNNVEANLEVVLEELLHGLSVQPFIKRAELLTNQERMYVATVNQLYESYLRRTPAEYQGAYRFINQKEFIIGMTIDKNFRRLMDNINSPKNPANNYPSLFQRLWRDFVDALRGLLNMPVKQRPPAPNVDVDSATILSTLSDYLNLADRSIALNASEKEPGRNYDLSFAVMTSSTIEEQKEQLDTKLTDEYKGEFKKRIKTLVGALRANSSLMNSIEADENFIFLFREARKMSEDIINEVDYLFSFINEFQAMTDGAVKIMRSIRDSNESDDRKIIRFTRVNNTINQFQSILAELEDIKESVLVGTPLELSISKILSDARTVSTLYDRNIKPLVSNKIATLAEPASQAAVEEQKKKVDELEKHLIAARKKGYTGRAKQLEKKVLDARERLDKLYTITPKFANDALSGLLGDTHTVSAWIEPAIVSSHIVPAAVAKNTADTMHSIAPQILDLNNAFQQTIDEYKKATGLNPDNIEEFNKPLLETAKFVKSMNEDGTFELEEALVLKGPYNLEYVQELEKFAWRRNALSHKITEAETEDEKKTLNAQLRDLMKERKQFMKDYMEQEFKDYVYDAMDLMDEDLGGFTARQVSEGLYEDRAKLEREFDLAESEEEEDRLIDLINSIDFKIKRLRYTEGIDPESKEYKAAKQLQKYDDAMKEYRAFEITPKKMNKFLREKQRVDDAYDRKEISKKARDHWYQKNTITEYTPEYYAKKKELIDQLNALREKLGIKTDDRNDLNSLYKRLELIVKAYRDNDGVINGLLVPEEEVKLVREIEESIDTAKEQIADLYGLSKADRNRIAELSAELENLDIDLLMAQGTPNAKAVMDKINKIQFEIEGLLLNKKNVHKNDATAYFNIIKRIADLNQTTSTEYYQMALEKETNKVLATVSVSSLPNRIESGDAIYAKHGDVWIRVLDGKQDVVDDISEVENAYKKNVAAYRVRETDWWAQNHITRLKYVDGDYMEVEDPIYIWKHTKPKLAGYVLNDQPSFKYRRSIIKPEHRNANYRDTPDGHNKPKMQGAKDNRFINKDYLRLSSSTDPRDKAIFNTINFLIKQTSEGQSVVPQKYRLGYKMPAIRKTDIERVLAGDTKEKVVSKVKGVFTAVAEDLSKNEQDKDILFGYNETLSSIPVKYLGDIDIKDQTRDVFRAMLMYRTETLKRKALMDALPFALAVKNILQSPENKPVKLDSKGKIVTLAKKIAGERVIAKLIPGESQTYKLVNEHIRTYFFGEVIKDEPGAKQINTLLGYGAKALLGLNYSASLVNRMNAWTQTLFESEVRIGAFSFLNALKAQGIYDINVVNGNFVKDIGKYGKKSKISQMFDYFGGSNFNIIQKQNKTLAYAKLTEGMGKILIPNEMAEHAIGTQLFIAMALEEKVKYKGTTISLFDAFEEDGNGIKLKDGVDFPEKARLGFIGRMNAAARRINGNYNLLDKVQAQKYAAGRMILFMNNYFVPFFTRRFGNERFSIEDGITQEGYWKTFGKILFKDVLSFQRSVIRDWAYYTEQEKAAIVRTSSEVGMSLLAMGIIAMLGGGEPEDLKDNTWLANNAIYVLKMFRRQNEQYMLIPGLGLDDIYQKLKSPFPIMGKLGNMASMANHAVFQAGYTAFGWGKESDFMYTRKSGWHQPGDLKIMTDVSRLFGFVYRFNQMANPDIAIKNMDAYRIK